MKKIKLSKEEAKALMDIINNESDDEMINQIDTKHMNDTIDDSEMTDNANVINPFVYVGDKRTETHQLHEVGLNFSKARNKFSEKYILFELGDNDLADLDYNNHQIHIAEVTNYIIDDAVQVFMATLYYSNFAKIYGPEICDCIVNNVNSDLLKADESYYIYSPTRQISVILNYASNDCINNKENINSERYDAIIYSTGLQIVSILIDQIIRSVDNAINCSCNYLMYNDTSKKRLSPKEMYRIKNAFLTEVSPLLADRISDNVNRILTCMNDDHYTVFGDELSRRNKNQIGKNNDNN